MKSFFSYIVTAMLVFTGMTDAMAVEEAKYDVVVKENNFEIRDYAPHIVAETLVEGNLEDAGSKAFNKLFRYISGNNRSREKVAMTAPVSQEQAREKIAMTAPVGQQFVEGKWAVSFMMPASYTLESLPEPADAAVRLRKVPARRMAVVQYSGFWSEKSYLEHKSELEAWLDARQLQRLGTPLWARYDAPFTPWFLRRNEIMIPVKISTIKE
jgi:hypothetical protein